jgi:4-aminobutyrate aminotransferase
MLVIGKGLGGGVFPMAALIAREELDIVGDLALGHYTHEKSSVGCAAALATINCLYEDNLIENAITLGKHAMHRLIKMQSRLSLIHEVRGLGLYLGIELRSDGKPANNKADTVLYHSLSRGLSYKVGGGCVLTLCPPMTITPDELNKALDIIEEGITSVS